MYLSDTEKNLVVLEGFAAETLSFPSLPYLCSSTHQFHLLRGGLAEVKVALHSERLAGQNVDRRQSGGDG